MCEDNTFVNPIYGGQDPFTAKGPDGCYYAVAEGAGSREIWVYRSRDLTDRGIRRTVWTAPVSGWNAYDVWAPEIWCLGGKWYIYYCASSKQGKEGDDRQFENWDLHRLGVLEAATGDPLGPYIDRGMFDVGDAMSIDASILQLDGDLFLLFTQREVTSKLFIAPMDSPIHLSGPPVMISEPVYDWESDINEGPQALIHGDHVYIIYSANAAHLPDYCLGQLTCVDTHNPLNPSSWVKSPVPVFRQSGNIMGPGHCSFTKSPDDREDWIIYHSKFDNDQTLPGGWNRVVNAQRFDWYKGGTPHFSIPVGRGAIQALPSGTKNEEREVDFSDDFHTDDHWRQYGYFRGNTIMAKKGVFSIDATADVRYGDKALVRGCRWSDFTAQADIRILTGDQGGGVIFRVHHAGIGMDILKGYKAILDLNGCVLLWKTGGEHSTILKTAPIEISAGVWYCLKITAIGDRIQIYMDDRHTPLIDVRDASYASGRIGLNAVCAHVHFRNFTVHPDA